MIPRPRKAICGVADMARMLPDLVQGGATEKT
jgi:hypothetical protein